MKKLFPLLLILVFTFFCVSSAFASTNISDIVGDNNFIPAPKTAPYKVAVNVSLPDGSDYNFINRYYTYSNQLLMMIQPASADTYLGTLSFNFSDLPSTSYVRFAVPTAVRSASGGISYLNDTAFFCDIIYGHDYGVLNLPGYVFPSFSPSNGKSYFGINFNYVQNSISNNYLGLYFSSIKSFDSPFESVNSEFSSIGEAEQLYLCMQWIAYIYNNNLQNTAFDGRIFFQTYSSEGFPDLNTDEFKLLKKVLADNNREVIQSIDELETSIVQSFDILIDMGDSRYNDFNSAMSSEHSSIVSDIDVIDSYQAPSARDFVGAGSHFEEALSVIGQDTALTAAFRGAISSALGNNLVMVILLAGAFLSVAGYLLFGKRG